MMRCMLARWLLLLCLPLFILPASARGSELILNEYNAVNSSIAWFTPVP